MCLTWLHLIQLARLLLGQVLNSSSFIYSELTMSEPAIERHVFGDSNIVRYLPKLKEAKSDPSIQTVSMTKSTNAVLLRDGLSNPKAAYPIIVIAALSNLITAKFFEDYDLLIEHCKSTFNDVLLWVQEGRNNLDGFAALVGVILYLAVALRLIDAKPVRR
jgi:hypothetical protein